MKLLIVDDQYRVVEGLQWGINWKNIGVDQVYTALGAFQAKETIQQEEIKIILCDIEMPGENGIELIRWVKRRYPHISCIVLTAHADFAYAQEALKLACTDYILQPASYPVIEESVRRAVQELCATAKKKELEQMGDEYKKQEKILIRNSIKNYLTGIVSKNQFFKLQEKGKVPATEQTVSLLMIQIIRWNSSEIWQPRLLSDTMENIAAETFEQNRLQVISFVSDYPCFGMVIWGEQLPDEDTMDCRLQFINSFYQQFFKCETAIYMAEPSPFQELEKTWQNLVNYRDDNVSLSNGVYTGPRKTDKGISSRVPEVRRWSGLLKEGHAQAVEEDAGKCLDRLVEHGVMNRNTLREFYQDFLQAVYYASQNGEGGFKRLFSTQEEFQLYLDGMRSVAQMKALISYVVRRFDGNLDETVPEDLVEKVVNYITDHMEEQIMRDDIAHYIHLNPDYLTRIFKRETGMTLKEFIIKTKMKEAQMLIESTRLPISLIAAKVGYTNFSHFSFSYKKIMGITPQEKRRGEAEEA